MGTENRSWSLASPKSNTLFHHLLLPALSTSKRGALTAAISGILKRNPPKNLPIFLLQICEQVSPNSVGQWWSEIIAKIFSSNWQTIWLTTNHVLFVEKRKKMEAIVKSSWSLILKYWTDDTSIYTHKEDSRYDLIGRRAAQGSHVLMLSSLTLTFSYTVNAHPPLLPYACKIYKIFN